MDEELQSNPIALPERQVQRETYKEDVLTILAIIKPSWPSEEITMKALSGGYSGQIYHCYWNKNSSESLIVRAGDMMLKRFPYFLDPEFEIKVILTLNKMNLFPRIFATFGNGYCYEFIKGETIATPEAVYVELTDDIYKKIAQRIVQIHSIKLEGVDYTKTRLFDRLHQMLDEDYPLEDDDIPSRKSLVKELNLIESHVRDLGCPLVLSHNDTHPGNMVYNKEDGSLTLMDWELVDINYQPMDIAIFFSAIEKWIAPALKIELMVQPEEYRSKFLKYYLQYWTESLGKEASDVTDKDMDKFSIQIKTFELVTYLFLGISCMAYAVAFSDVSMRSIGLMLLQDYFKEKDEVVAL